MTKKSKATPAPTMPTPVKEESRICFGIMWFATEAEAQIADQLVRASGATYNGGWFHGMACGRDPAFDGPSGFAVTC